MKVDTRLILLKFRQGGSRLFASLQPETLSFEDAPTEFLGFARIRMAGLVSQGAFTQFEVYEKRFHLVWERMRALAWATPVRFVIAAGTSIEHGFKVIAADDSGDDRLVARLTITASPAEVIAWHPHCFELSVRRAVRELGKDASVCPAAIRHALTQAARFSLPVRDYPLPAARRLNSVHRGRGYVVHVDAATLRVEVEVREPRELAARDDVAALGRKVQAAVQSLAGATGATPFYRLYPKTLLSAVAEALDGAQALQLELPLTVPAASVVSEPVHGSEASPPVALGSLEAVLAFEMVRFARTPLETHKFHERLRLPELAGPVKNAFLLLGKARLLRAEGEPRVLVATRGVQVEPFATCGAGPTPYVDRSIALAEAALGALNSDERDLHALTLSLSRTSVGTIRERLAVLRGKVRQVVAASLAKADGDSQVFQVNWQLFPLMKPAGLEATTLPPDVVVRMERHEKRTVGFLIREMVALASFHPDPQWIVRKLYPPLTSAEVRQALRALEAQGMIRFSKRHGRFQQVERDVKTSEVVDGLAIVDYHREMLGFAAAAARYAGPEHRDLGGATVTLAAADAEVVRQLLLATLREIFDLASNDKDPDTLYQLNMQLFPLTKR